MVQIHVTIAEYAALYDAVAAAERPAVFAAQPSSLDIGQYTHAIDRLFGPDVARDLLDALRRREPVRVVVVRDVPQHRITPSP